MKTAKLRKASESAKNVFKRHIYRCLATILEGNFDDGAEYIYEAVAGYEGGNYEGPPLKYEAVKAVVFEVRDLLQRRGESRNAARAHSHEGESANL